MSAERPKSKVARNSRIELSLHTFNEFLYTLNNTFKTLQLNTSKLEVATRGEPKAVQAVRAEHPAQAEAVLPSLLHRTLGTLTGHGDN